MLSLSQGVGQFMCVVGVEREGGGGRQIAPVPDGPAMGEKVLFL